MSDEHIVSLQSSMQFRPTRWPVVVLQTLEEQFPDGEKSCWVQTKELCHSEDLYVRKNKMFYMNHMLPFIFCGLRL